MGDNYPPGYYCTHCPHAVFLHNPDGSCSCGMNCGTDPATAPMSMPWKWLQSTHELQSRTYGYDLDWFEEGLRLHVPSITKELASYISWNSFAAFQEIAEMNVEFSWKPWAVDKPFVNRERIINEVVDVNHFLGNILTAMGVTDEEYEAIYQAKQQKNRERAASGSYSAQKGGLGEGSDA